MLENFLMLESPTPVFIPRLFNSVGPDLAGMKEEESSSLELLILPEPFGESSLR